MMTLVTTQEPREADIVLRELYRAHRWSLVRLASLLVDDPGDAEAVVHDAFVSTYAAWPRLRETDRALPYLRRTVLNGARSRLRHRRVVERVQPGRPGQAESPEAVVVAREDHRRVVEELRALPARQRECLVLRYYLDLSEAEIAAALGISPGSVKTHAHRGLASLAGRLGGTR